MKIKMQKEKDLSWGHCKALFVNITCFLISPSLLGVKPFSGISLFFLFLFFFFSFKSNVPPFYQLTACLPIPMATQQAVAFLISLAVGVPGMSLGSSNITKGFCRE